MLRILLGVLVGLCLIAGAALVQAQTSNASSRHAQKMMAAK
jgi:hypothetical protein